MQSLARTLTTGVRRLRRLSQGFWPVHGESRHVDPLTPDVSAFGHYAECARAMGIDQLYLFLSFDCDTDEDAAAAGDVYALLDRLGIAMTLAVPGAQLEKNAETYGALGRRGVEFMNHGARPHAGWQVDRYVPITFYSKMTSAEIDSDIKSGHDIVTRITGQAPMGFRAPHFGCFQEPQQLAQLYRAAKELGYTYCSTTLPQAGLDRGPLFSVDSIVEIPTFGSARCPTVLLDSWTYLADRKDYRLLDEYSALLLETIDIMTRSNIPGILTWYADPSHVIAQAPFIKAMEGLAQRGIPSVTGSACAAFARHSAI
jgi:peptidoglycan/xylan/chitin deacetylase (PgdA/CDA1 family)